MTPQPGQEAGREGSRGEGGRRILPSAAAAVAIGNGFVHIPTFAQHICGVGRHRVAAAVKKLRWRVGKIGEHRLQETVHPMLRPRVLCGAPRRVDTLYGLRRKRARSCGAGGGVSCQFVTSAGFFRCRLLWVFCEVMWGRRIRARARSRPISFVCTYCKSVTFPSRNENICRYSAL